MPAIFAHYIFGAEALADFAAPMRRIVCAHRGLFDLGLQGPDFYFFDQFQALRGKHYSKTGSALHHGSCAELLLALEGEGGRRPTSAELAYLFGLIGHFALDSTAHPAIERWVMELTYDHHRLETEFDRYLLERRGFDPRRFALGDVIAVSWRERLLVGRLYEKAGLGDAHDIAALWRDFRWIKNHTTFASDKTYTAVQKLIAVTGARSISGIFMGPKDALSDVTNPRMMEVFAEGQKRYQKLVENYWQHVFCGAALDDYFLRDFETEPEGEKQ